MSLFFNFSIVFFWLFTGVFSLFRIALIKLGDKFSFCKKVDDLGDKIIGFVRFGHDDDINCLIGVLLLSSNGLIISSIFPFLYIIIIRICFK